jgi:RNA polymerase sigma-70 factor (ECF subfamily)
MPEPRSGLPSTPEEFDGSLLQSIALLLQRRYRRDQPDTLLSLQLERFFAVYTELLRKFAFQRGVRKQDVDDLVQNVWARFVAHPPRGFADGHGAAVRSWMFLTVRSLLIDELRRKKRHPVQELADVQNTRCEPATDHFLRELERAWECELVRIVVAHLQAEVEEVNAQILQLYFLDERSVEEVAERLHLTPEQIKHRASRLRKRLEGRLAFYRGEPLQPASATADPPNAVRPGVAAPPPLAELAR